MNPTSGLINLGLAGGSYDIKKEHHKSTTQLSTRWYVYIKVSQQKNVFVIMILIIGLVETDHS